MNPPLTVILVKLCDEFSNFEYALQQQLVTLELNALTLKMKHFVNALRWISSGLCALDAESRTKI